MSVENTARRRIYSFVMRGLMYFAVGVTAVLIVTLALYLLVKGAENISWQLISKKPSYLSGSIGILPDILNIVYI